MNLLAELELNYQKYKDHPHLHLFWTAARSKLDLFLPFPLCNTGLLASLGF